MVRRETYWTTITDSEGVVEQELSFDAWGNRRDPNTWIRLWSDPIYEEPMFDRGYTGHEHMTAFGLINMNGRCYDPVMSSFLSVDAFVQSPDNSQNFNRYSYCLNNPLKYTDPSGWVMLGGMTPSNPFHDNWGQNFGEKIYTATEVRQMLWTTDISIGIWMVGNEMHGSRGGDAVGSNYTVDKKGYIKNVGSNDKTIDLLYTQDSWDNGNKDIFVEIPIGVLEKRNTLSVEGTDGKIYTFDMYTIRDDELSTRVFEFLAANTDVEWSQTFVGNPKSEISILSTSHDERTEIGQGYLLRNGWTIRAHNHSHPYHDYPSKGDLKWAKAVHEMFPKTVLKIYYKNNYYEYDELGPLVIPSYNYNVLNGVNVLDTRIKP